MSLKISVDGGGLGVKREERFGNYVFSKNLIKALLKYDKKNQYYIYTFAKLKPRFAWSKIRLSIEEFIEKKDVFLALNQAIPFYVSGKIISFCHGLSYYFYPQYYPDSYQKLKSQLETMVKKSSYIIVSSQKVKNELMAIFPKIEEKIKPLPFGIPFDMESKIKVNPPADGQSSKIRNKYFLFVGMAHPIKNIEFIRKAFEEFKKDSQFSDYKLYLITKNTSRKKLRQLYQRAAALLTASFYESFNLPVLEALSCRCPVIGLPSAIIPELTSYVHLARNFEEFVVQMKTVAKGQEKPIDRKRLKKHFSWEKYVRKLQKLYYI